MLVALKTETDSHEVPEFRIPKSPLIQSYEVHVDQEYGLVLSLLGHTDDRVVASWQVDHIELGVPMNDSTFSIAPPYGVQLHDARKAITVPRSVRIEQAAEKVRFTLFVPVSVPGAALIVPTFCLVTDEGVISRLEIEDTDIRLTVRQRALSKRNFRLSKNGWHFRMVDGHSVEVGEGAWCRTVNRVRSERDGTLIELSGPVPLLDLVQIIMAATPFDRRQEPS
jgi:hypothetical protein